MAEIWFTADTHFGHTNIIKHCNRPFAGADEMDRVLLDNINQHVAEQDTLWHLGDFAFGFGKRPYVQRCEQYRRNIRCRHMNIVWGNHDRATRRRPGDDDYLIRHLFDNAYHLTTIKAGGEHIVLCHYALAVWNKSHHGAWHLYGHSHSMAEEGLDKRFPRRRSMDVGVDNAYRLLGEYRPFNLVELRSMLPAR